MPPDEPMVTVVGSVNLDHSFAVSRLPKPGETILAHSLEVANGGKGANQAVAAATTGARVSLIAAVGDDESGTRIVSDLETRQIDTTWVMRDPSTSTGTAHIVVDVNGSNQIVVHPAANDQLDADHVATAFDALGQASRVVVLSLEIPLGTVMTTAIAARKRSWTVVLNPAPFREMPSELWKSVDVVVANESEFEGLTGVTNNFPPDVPVSSIPMLEINPELGVAVTMGARGVAILRDDRWVVVEAHATNAVDTTGAGDAFVGVLAAELAADRDLPDAATRANQAAARAVARRGAWLEPGDGDATISSPPVSSAGSPT